MVLAPLHSLAWADRVVQGWSPTATLAAGGPACPSERRGFRSPQQIHHRETALPGTVLGAWITAASGPALRSLRPVGKRGAEAVTPDGQRVTELSPGSWRTA